MNYAQIKEYARSLRKNQTPAEEKLWKHLRNKQIEGRTFLRQHPVLCRFSDTEYFYFIPDFYCHKELLIIELDGSVHDHLVMKDSQREAILLKAGYNILRFKNEELNQIDQVLKTVESHFTN